MTTKLTDARSRRGLLAGGTAALLAAGATAQPAQAVTGDDAEILRVFAAWLPLQRRYQALSRQLWDLEDRHLPTDALHAQFEPLVPLQQELAEEIADLRATTMEGLRAKATVLLYYSGYEHDRETPVWTNYDELLGWSIARDLLGDDAARAEAQR